MSWAGLANNQTVSFANLKNAVDTGVFLSKTTQSTSNEQITKADADTYVYIDTTYSPYSSKSSNQLVVKSNLRAGFAVYGASYGCVVPETMILIDPTFSRSADTFDVGDVVYTKHEDTGVWGHYKVAAIERKEQPILNISTDRGGIRCSTTHLLLKEGEYVKAEELMAGDIISHIEGDAVITDIVSEGVSTVIEFNIEDAHTYVAAGFIAHNKCTLNGWTNCGDACSNGVTAYGTNVYYTGTLGVGTVINTTSCLLSYPRFYYYPGGFLEIDFISSQYEVVSLGSCGSCAVDIFIDNNNSLDIPITDMTINGVSVTYVSGANFTINAGNNGNFSSQQLGTYTVIIYYGGHIPGQNIAFTDSNNNVTCKDLNGSAGSFTIANAVITGGTTVYVTAQDGACF